MTTLEHRYRRLLALYPRRHRERYEDEMLAVLMADSAPGRTRPGIAATADLVFHALRQRLLPTTGGAPAGPWRDAATLVALLASIALPLVGLRGVLAVAMSGSGVHAVTPYDAVAVGLELGWLVVLLLALTGVRQASATLAGLLTAGAAVWLVAEYLRGPVYVDYASAFYAWYAAASAWIVALGIVATVGLVVGAPVRGVAASIGVGRMTAVVVASAAAILAANAYQLGLFGDRYRSFMALHEHTVLGDAARLLPYAGVLVVCGLALWRRAVPGALPRALVLLVPVMVMRGYAATALDYWGWAVPSAALAAAGWIGLLAVPLLAFALALLAVRVLGRRGGAAVPVERA